MDFDVTICSVPKNFGDKDFLASPQKMVTSCLLDDWKKRWVFKQIPDKKR